jgi:long-chain acyl-CoA synthetase
MGSLGFWQRALADPDRIAAVEPDGTPHAAGDLLARVNQLTHGLRALGLAVGDGVAVLAPNGVAPLEVYLAAQQAGWYVTPINWHFTAPEIAYIVRDSGAKAFFVHERYGPAGASAAEEAGVPASGRIGYGDVPGFRPVERVREGQPTTLPDDRTAGSAMHYTSGTTG